MSVERQKERWNNRQKNKILSLFTPRIKKDIDLVDNSKINSYVYLLEQEKNIYFHGRTGSGKTLVACATLLQIAKKSFLNPQIAKIKTFAFLNVPEFFETLKNNFGQNEKITELINYYKNVDLLIFDDIGIEKTNEWVLSMLYLLINYRYEYLKLNIYTCNLTKNELAKRLNDDRLLSRINANCISIKKEDIDFRAV